VCREEPGLRRHLWSLRERLAKGLAALGADTFGSATPILPVRLGRPEAALKAQAALWDAGLWVPAIRPPTVPKDSCRLRISLSARHSEQDVDRLLTCLKELL
jgi:8-amino-7-oxononanoate synthase